MKKKTKNIIDKEDKKDVKKNTKTNDKASQFQALYDDIGMTDSHLLKATTKQTKKYNWRTRRW